MMSKRLLHYILFPLCSVLVSSVLAQESEVSEASAVEKAYFEPRFDFGGYGAVNKMESPLNPGNFAGFPKSYYELVANAGADFEGGRIRTRFAFKNDEKDDGWHSNNATQLLSLYKAFDVNESTNVTLGKKNIHLDSGFAFHSLNFFEDLSTIGDFGQWYSGEEGFPLISFSHTSSFGTMNAVYADDVGLDSKKYNRGLRQALISISNSGNSWDGVLLLQKYDIGSMGFGGGISSTLSNALAVSASFFVRPGSIRPFFGSSEGRAASLYPRSNYSLGRWWADEKNLFSKFLMGAQYTFESNINLILEYFYDGDGVSGEDWDRFREQISAIQMLPVEAARAGAYANGLVSLATRRQHYVSSHLKFDQVELKPEIGVLLGENEGGQLNIKLQHKVYSILIWGRFSQNLGPAQSEFSLFPVHSNFSAGARWEL